MLRWGAACLLKPATPSLSTDRSINRCAALFGAVRLALRPSWQTAQRCRGIDMPPASVPSAALNRGLYGNLIRAVYAHANQDVDRTNPNENSPGQCLIPD